MPLLLALLAVPDLLFAQEPSGFLLRQRFRLIQQDAGIDSTVERVIFRDGLIITTILTPGQTVFERRRAPKEALRRLHNAFRIYRVGEQRGECTDGTTPFDFYSQTLTWFTVGPTGHTFRTGDAYSEPCGLGLTLLLSELSDFLNASNPEPGLQDVRVPN